MNLYWAQRYWNCASIFLRAGKMPQAVHRYLVTWYFITPILSEVSESGCNIQTACICHWGLLSALLIPVDAETNGVSLEQAQKLLGIDRRWTTYHGEWEEGSVQKGCNTREAPGALEWTLCQGYCSENWKGYDHLNLRWWDVIWCIFPVAGGLGMINSKNILLYEKKMSRLQEIMCTLIS